MGSSSNNNNNSSSSNGVPPGFRFHPTDEELLHYYLKKKISFHKFEMEVIRDVDLNKLEPWDLQERCRIGSTPQNEWYFFSHKDRKYPTGSRTNRATNAGFWKATGRDKCIRNSFQKIGMRKTLVFYRGRAPHGQKTDWIMHEYRLEDADHNTADHDHSHQEEGWVVCRVFKKKNLFKVGGASNEGGGSSSTASATNNYNIINNNNITNNSTTSSDHYHRHHHLLLNGTTNHHHHHDQAILGGGNNIQYPVPHHYLMMQPTSFELNSKPPQPQPQALVSDHEHHDLGLHTHNYPPRHHQYFPTSTTPGLLSSHYQPSLSCQVDTTAATSSDHHHHQHQDQDHQPPLSEWTMLDRPIHGDDDVDDTTTTNNNGQAVVLLPPNLSVSLSHNDNINHLSLGATTASTTIPTTTTEMDFWGYAK